MFFFNRKFHVFDLLMNVHIYATFSNDANNTPFAEQLRQNGLDFKIFSKNIPLRYSHRIWLYCVGWPRLILFAFKQSLRTLFDPEKPEWVVVSSHFDILVISFLATVLMRKKPKLLLVGFIYTQRTAKLSAYLKFVYFSIILRLTEVVISHSPLEVEKNATFFKIKAKKFRYIPYGLYIDTKQNIPRSILPPYVISAGRSGRDYDLLIKVFSENGLPLRIVCDNDNLIKNKVLPENIKLLRQCYGKDYINELSNSKLVIIPISVEDISAGQMVLIQAMAFKKPIIITDTPTTRIYVEHNKSALLIKKGSAAEMQAIITKLWQDDNLCQSLANEGYQRYIQNYAMSAYAKNICEILQTAS